MDEEIINKVSKTIMVYYQIRNSKAGYKTATHMASQILKKEKKNPLFYMDQKPGLCYINKSGVRTGYSCSCSAFFVFCWRQALEGLHITFVFLNMVQSNFLH